ncbi:MAG: hypothetical protein JST39_07195 [Bacteroidetes bacterium]|nr:hypothetical protein [Bacteroidota bacterium]
MQAMNINRHNYESFFLLYIDNELDASGRKAVEEFVQQHPDLGAELTLLQQAVLPADDMTSFAGKENLLRGEEAGIHAGNYEEFFIAYADDELSNADKSQVEAFVYHHPQYQRELELLQIIRLQPDTSIVHPDKESLYRREKDDKVIPFRWWRPAAAAAILLLVGLWWVNREKATVVPPQLAGTQTKQGGDSAMSKENITRHEGSPNDTTLAEAGTGKNKDNKETLAGTDPKQNNPSPVAPGPVVRPQQTHEAIANNDKTNRHKATAQNGTEDPQAPVTTPPVNKTIVVAMNNEPSHDAVLPDRPRNALSTIRVNARPAMTVRTATINHPDESIVSNAVYDANEHSNDDRIEIMNTSVKKSSLRGLLRKASRVIAKKAGAGDGDDDDQRHILIGSFAIAVK